MIDKDIFLKHNEDVNPETKITKYMSFERFVSLLLTSKMWFSSPKFFDDKTEGEFYINDLLFQPVELENGGTLHTFPYDMKEQVEFLNKKLDNIYIHTWTNSDFDFESYALWKVFVPHGIGVKLTVTVEDLLNSIDPIHKKYIKAKNVTYTDKSNTGLIKYLKKSVAYEYEKEIRVILDYIDSGVDVKGIVSRGNPIESKEALIQATKRGREIFCKETGYDPDKIEAFNGIQVPCDLSCLLTKSAVVTPSPFKGSWSTSLIENVKSKFGYEFQISQSLLSVRD